MCRKGMGIGDASSLERGKIILPELSAETTPRVSARRASARHGRVSARRCAQTRPQPNLIPNVLQLKKAVAVNSGSRAGSRVVTPACSTAVTLSGNTGGTARLLVVTLHDAGSDPDDTYTLRRVLLRILFRADAAKRQREGRRRRVGPTKTRLALKNDGNVGENSWFGGGVTRL